MQSKIPVSAAVRNAYTKTVEAKQRSELINQGMYPTPHIQTVRGRYSSHNMVYAIPDKALQEGGYPNTQAMENDLLLRECIESRMRTVAMQEVDVAALDISKYSSEEKDKWEEENRISAKKINTNQWDVEELRRKMLLIRHIEHHPNHRIYALMNAIWIGRSGVENKFGSKYVQGVGMCKNVIVDWRPKHGDKYIFRFDDGTRRSEEGQVGLRVTSWADRGRQKMFTDFTGKKHQKILPTQYGLAYLLDPIEKAATTIHKHIIEDYPFEEPRMAGGMYGVGIRSRVYWTWFQMQETIKIMLNFLERTGLGIEMWPYQANNPEHEKAVRKMMEARGSSGYSAFLVPIMGGEDGQLYEPRIVEPGPGGVSEINSVITERYHDQIKRYIMGQKLTSEAEGTGMGSGVADAHMATFHDIIKFDSTNLENTETKTLRYQQTKMFPGSEGVFLSFKLKSESADKAEKMEAMERAHGMGFNINPDHLGDVLGLSEAPEGQGLADRHASQMAAAGTPSMFSGFDQSPQNQSMFPPNMINGDDRERYTGNPEPVRQVADLFGATDFRIRPRL